MAAFRLDPEVLEVIKNLTVEDPYAFRSQAEIIDAALFHFIGLSRKEQKNLLKLYLTRDLED